MVFRDKSEWISIPNAVPMIIDHELFDKVQQQLKANSRKAPRNRVHQYLFSGGILRCGICGHVMTTTYTTYPAGNGAYRAYRCASNCRTLTYDKCNMPAINADAVEEAVWNELAQALKKKEVIRAGINKFRESNSMSKLETEVVLKQKQLDGVRQEKTVYLRQFGKGLIDETMWIKEAHRADSRIDSLQHEIDDLMRHIDTLKQQTLHYDHLESTLDDIAYTVEHAETFEQKRGPY